MTIAHIMIRKAAPGDVRKVQDSLTALSGVDRAVVDLTPRPDGGTDVLWSATFEPVVPGTGPLLRWFLRATVRSFATRLARTA